MGEKFALKKTLPVAVCVLMLCSVLLIGIAKAGNPAYSIIEAISANVCVVDGKWTTPDEWTDTIHAVMSGTGEGEFGYNIQDFTNLGLEWKVEFFSDNTNDPGDIWQICLDSDNSGGSAPQVGDFKIEITGHSTLKLYQGNGAGWTEVSPADGELTWSNTLGTSVWNSAPHWILEVVDSSKTAGTIQTGQPDNGMMVSAYDASTGNRASWAPGADANVPSGWGVIDDFSMEPVTIPTIPENIGLIAVLIVSSVAVLSGIYYQRKRLGIASSTLK